MIQGSRVQTRIRSHSPSRVLTTKPSDLLSLAAGRVIQRIDLNANANRQAHRTSTYGNKNLIVRRGEAFTVDVTFNKQYKKDSDTLYVQLTTGKDGKYCIAM